MRHFSLFISVCLLLFSLCISVHAKIVFDSKREGDKHYHVYVMEDDGSNVRRITSPLYYDTHPRWFPDGERILFARDLTKGSGQPTYRFYIQNINSQIEHRIFSEKHPRDRHPVVSPDGNYIAFNRAQTGNIYVYNLENGDLKQVTNNGEDEWSYRLDWSPDGRKIVYEQEGVNGEDIWIMNADGKGKRRVSPRRPPQFFLAAPSWSPSGKYIMYPESERTPDIQKLLVERLIILNVQTGHHEEHEFPKGTLIVSGCWMGDDRTVLLSMTEDYTAATFNTEIYRYDLRSRKLTNLTNQTRGDYWPHWIEGSLAVFPLDKLAIRWSQLKQTD